MKPIIRCLLRGFPIDLLQYAEDTCLFGHALYKIPVIHLACDYTNMEYVWCISVLIVTIIAQW